MAGDGRHSYGHDVDGHLRCVDNCSEPDPYDGSYSATDPQSFNRYSYVRNNPMSLLDPSGLQAGDGPCHGDPTGCGGDGDGSGWIISLIDGIIDGISDLFGLGAPSFHGSLTLRPNSVASPGYQNGMYTYNVSAYTSSYTLTNASYTPSGGFGGGGFFVETGGGGQNNGTPRPWKIHGNWCGPDWTGGRAGSYDPAIDASGGYSPPIDKLDEKCMVHDKCYYSCRAFNPCNASARASCFSSCDIVLSRGTTFDFTLPGQEINLVMPFRGAMGSWHPNEPNSSGCMTSH